MSTAFVSAGLLFAGVLSVASAQAATASANVGATVIAPVSVMISWADLPVTVSLSGGWVRLVMPPARLPLRVSSLSHPLNEADLAVGVSSAGSTTLLRAATAADLRGEFTTSLSPPAPLNDGSYRVTVAFN